MKTKAYSENQNPHVIQLYNQIDFLTLQRKYEQVLPLLNALIQLELYNHELHFRRANIHFELRNLTECVKDCDAALHHDISERKDSNSGISDQNMAYSFILKGNILALRALLQAEDYQEADRRLKVLTTDKKELGQLLMIKTAIDRLKDSNACRLPDKQENILRQTKEWLYPAGSYYDKLKVLQMTPEYRGVIATKHIKERERVVYVPYSHMITLEMAKKTKLARKVIQNKIELLSPKHTILSIFLLEQARKLNSKWKLYLDILPKDHSAFPINYTKEQLSQLTGSNFLFQIREKVFDLKKDFDTLIAADADFLKYSFKDFCWARMIIGSRIFGLIIDGIKTQALVPFADMLNHKVPKQTVWNYSQQLNGFTIESLEDIMPGQQVFDSYGKKCNSRFLLNYAFVIPNNRQNQASFRMDLDESDPLLERKLQIIKNREELRVYKLTVNMQENAFYELMGFLRFYNISENQNLFLLERISGIKKTGEPYRPTRTPPVNIRLELAAWQHLQKMCMENLKNYPTTLGEDKILLKKKLSENMRNIVILRLGEKIVFQQYIKRAEGVITLLGQTRKEIQKYIQQNKHLPYSKYFQNILPLLFNNSNKERPKNLSKQPNSDQKDKE